MITEEKLRKIYETVTKENIFKTKELLEMGFKKDDLTTLVNNKTLNRIRVGYYELSEVERLFQYGKELLYQGNVARAREIFEICYKIDPNHKETLFQLFLKSIKELDYQKAFNYLDSLIKIDNDEHNQIDYNVFLYLLNQLIDLPENYQNLINTFEEEDLKIKPSNKYYRDIDGHNQVRKFIFSKNSSFAISKLNTYFGYSKEVRIQITRSLITAIINREQILSWKIIDLIEKEDYEAIIELLEKENVKNLNQYIGSILDIAKDILEVQRTKEAIESSYKTVSTIRAIQYKNYELALSLRSDYNAYTRISNDKDALYLIIKAMVMKNEEVKSRINDNDLLIITALEERLINKDIPNAIKYIKELLVSIKKENYEALVIKLLKLNLFRKTNNFKFITNFLKGLLENKLELNITDLIKEYELSFKNNNHEKATLILEILKELEKLGLASNITSGLEIKSKSNIEERKEEVSKVPIPEPALEPQKETMQSSLSENAEIDPEIKAFMDTVYQRLEENELIILSREESLKLDILVFNKEYRKAHAFKIGTNGIVVVKTTRYVSRDKAFEHTKNGDEAFKNGNWEEAINEYKEVLPLRNVYTRVYANLGISYMNLNNTEEAIKYLTIATGLSELNPLIKFDYRKLINELKGKKTSEIKKEDRDEKSTDLNYYYNVYNIKGIADLINQGFTLEEAFKKSNTYSSEQNMIILLLARDCYARAQFEKGDEYLNIVERIEHKSKQVKRLLESLKANKLLYQDKVNESYKPLLLENPSISPETPKETKCTTKASMKELFRKDQSNKKNKSDLDDDYGSKRLKEVIILMNFQGMTAKEACEVLCVDKEETNKIYLVLAKECYALNEFEMGDKYLLEVERNSPSNAIKSLVVEIRNNKRFYSNRIDENYKPLVRERTLIV